MALRGGLAAAIVLLAGAALADPLADFLADCIASRQRACLVETVIGEAMARTDAADQIGALSAVAKLLAASGDAAGALALLQRSEMVAEAIPEPFLRDDARVMLVQGYADAGAFQAGLKATERIEDPGQREFARSNVAIAAADAGDIATVELLLPEANLQLGDELRESLLDAFGEADEWPRVIEVARELVFWNPDIARWLMGELVARGYLEDALALRDRIDVIGLREFAVRGVIDGFIRRHEYLIARHIAGQSQNPYHSDSALVDIATAMAREGDIAGAEAIIAVIKDGETQGDGLVRLATELAARGDYAAALAVGRRAETDPPPARDAATTQRLPRLIYDAIARAQAAGGDASGALATARRISDRTERNVTLHAVAAQRIDVGDFGTAAAIFDEFLAGTAPVAAPVLRDAARDAGRMHDVGRATRLTQLLSDPADRANTLLRAAMQAADEAEPYAALLNAAAETIATIANPRQRQSANGNLAVLRARARQAPEAAGLLAGLGDADRSRALLSLAFPRLQPLP